MTEESNRTNDYCISDTDVEMLENDAFDDINIENKLKDINEYNPVSTSKENKLEGLFNDSTLIEISRYSWNNSYYLRGCHWSPDGTCCLTIVNGDGMHLVELPTEFYETESIKLDRPFDVLLSAVHVPETTTVYDSCWYPNMHSMAPESCCWLATRQHEPIQMWDAFDGKLRCSYRGYNSVDELEAALSVQFSSDGEQIFAGYKKTLKIFHTTVPGKDCLTYPSSNPISCISEYSCKHKLLALGSWNKTILLCDPRDRDLNVIKQLTGHLGGVTFMKILEKNETLITGSRRENKLLEWDLRNPTTPLHSYIRSVDTNQRIYFDISPENDWLLSGDTNGFIHIWSLKDKQKQFSFPVHKDCCNGVSIHPFKNILATSTGQYHDPIDDKTEQNNEENSLIFWWFGKYIDNITVGP